MTDISDDPVKRRLVLAFLINQGRMQRVDLARMLQVELRTINLILSNGDVTLGDAARSGLRGVMAIQSLLLSVYGIDEAGRWMTTATPILGGRAPSDILGGTRPERVGQVLAAAAALVSA